MSISLFILLKNNAENEEFIKNKESIIIYSEKIKETKFILSLYNSIADIYNQANKNIFEQFLYLQKTHKFIELCEEKQSNLLNSSQNSTQSNFSTKILGGKFDTLGLNLDINKASEKIKDNQDNQDSINNNIENDKKKLNNKDHKATITFKIVSPQDYKTKSHFGRRAHSINEPTFESLVNLKSRKGSGKKDLIIEEEDKQDQSPNLGMDIDNKMKNIIDKFKPEKKTLKSGSLLALLNFQIKTSPFLIASNINICEVFYCK